MKRNWALAIFLSFMVLLAVVGMGAWLVRWGADAAGAARYLGALDGEWAVYRCTNDTDGLRFEVTTTRAMPAHILPVEAYGYVDTSGLWICEYQGIANGTSQGVP